MKVFTESGSAYEIDVDAKTVRRIPGDDASQLRKDDTAVPLIDLQSHGIGSSMIFVIDVRGDGVHTIRQTTPVTRIEP